MEDLRRFIPGRPAQILIGAFVVVVLLFLTRPAEVPESRGERAWSVDVIPVVPATLSPTLELFGQVQSPQDAELSAGTEAVVISRLVMDGDTVAEGDELVLLDDRDARLTLQQNVADLKEAEAQFNFAKIRLDRSRQAYEKENELLAINAERASRAEEIFSEGLLSRADLETTAENLARQQLALNQAELNIEENSAKLLELEARIARLRALRDRAALDLDRTRITAPFSGVISDMQVSEGDRVRTGDPLMRLQNPDSVEVRAQLPTRIARSITDSMQEGSVILATVDVGGRTVAGRLMRVSRQTRAGSGGVDSFIGFDTGVTGLRLGSTVRVLLELPPEPNVIAVPGEAIYGENQVYKLNGDRMQMLTAERVGEREFADGRTEVLLRTPLLNSNDELIATKLANAADGLLIKRNAPRVAGQPDLTTAVDIETAIDAPEKETARP